MSKLRMKVTLDVDITQEQIEYYEENKREIERNFAVWLEKEVDDVGTIEIHSEVIEE